MTNPQSLIDWGDLKKAAKECADGNGSQITLHVKESLLYSFPKEFEMRITSEDNDFGIFEIMHQMLTKEDNYQLYWQKDIENIQSSFYQVTPSMFQTIQDNLGFYQYVAWIKQLRETGFMGRKFRKQDLRNKARYYYSKGLDSTAREYYTSFMEHHYYQWLVNFKSFGEAQSNLFARLLAISIEETPTAYKAVELQTVSELIRRMSLSLNNPNITKTPNFHIKFLTDHR